MGDSSFALSLLYWPPVSSEMLSSAEMKAFNLDPDSSQMEASSKAIQRYSRHRKVPEATSKPSTR